MSLATRWDTAARTIGPPLENFLNYPVSFIDLVCLGRAVYCPASVGVLYAPFQQGCWTWQSSGKTFI